VFLIDIGDEHVENENCFSVMMKVEQMRIDKIAARGFREIMFELFDSKKSA